MTWAQSMALVALFALVGINILYLTEHVISKHHGLEAGATQSPA